MKYKSLDHYLKSTSIPTTKLAYDLGVSESYVSLLRRGKRRPGADVAIKLARMTGIPLGQILQKND